MVQIVVVLMEHVFSLLVAPGAIVHVVLEPVRVDGFEGSEQFKCQLLKLLVSLMQKTAYLCNRRRTNKLNTLTLDQMSCVFFDNGYKIRVLATFDPFIDTAIL